MALSFDKTCLAWKPRVFEGVQSNNGKLMVWGPVVWIPKGSPYERVWDSWGYPFQKIPNHSWPQTSRLTIIVDTGMSWSIIFCLCWTFTGAKLIGFSNLWWPFFVMNRKAPETSIKTDKSIILRPFWLMWTDNPPPNMAKKIIHQPSWSFQMSPGHTFHEILAV